MLGKLKTIRVGEINFILIMKNLMKITIALAIVGGMFSFTTDKSLEAKAVTTEKTVFFETDNAEELARFDISRFRDVLTKENWDQINEMQKISLFKLKITVKGKGTTDIDIQGKGF